MWPPSSAGTGSRLSTPRFTEIMHRKNSSGSSPWAAKLWVTWPMVMMPPRFFLSISPETMRFRVRSTSVTICRASEMPMEKASPIPSAATISWRERSARPKSFSGTAAGRTS